MSSTILQTILNEDALQSLSDEVKTTLEDRLTLKDNTIINLEGEIQKIKADYEQKCYELDKKFIESASRLDSESTQNEKATARCSELEKQLEELQALHKDAESSLHECQNENLSLRRVKDTWDEDRLNLEHVIQKRDLEISNLNDEWKKVSDRLLEATNSKNELQLKLDEISSSEVTAHYHLKRLEQEKELLTDQNAQLNENLNQKTQQLLDIKKEKDEEIISLRGRLDLCMSDAKQSKELCETLKKNDVSMREKLNELQEKYEKATEEHHEGEELHRNRLQSQSRLAELYKESSEEAEKKSEELISAVEELQEVVKRNSEEIDNLNKQLTESKNETQEFYKETEKLKKELEGANDLIMANKRREMSHEELSELCPSAALTSKFIKSGMTLTQIYSQYVEQTDELIVAKEENKRLNEAMDSILNELNEKAPLLKRQREDYERALVTINEMTVHSDQSAIEFQQLRQDADDATRRNQILKSDNEKLHKEAADLSKQICFLLREVEELRGRQILMSPRVSGNKEEKSLLVVNEDGSCNDVSSSSELISQTLVTFKDIAELQEQNQKLLAVIRKLSDEQEESEKSTVDSRITALQHEVEMAKDEVEHLREDRSRQIDLVETVVRQRDMYRVLLAQHPEGGVPPTVLASPSLLANTTWTPSKSTPVTPTSRPMSKSPRTPDLISGESAKKALVQLQDEYTEYKKEVLDNNKVSETKIKELQDELLVQKGNSAKLDAHLEFSKERYEIMKGNIDSNKKEADSLRNRNQQLYNAMQQHERNTANLTAELSNLRDTNAKLQARLETNRREMEICKRTEERVSSENASLQREHRSQMVLLANLQKMQQSMETQAFEVKSQLNSRIEAQEREIKALRQNNQHVARSKQDQIQSVERQLYVVQKQFDGEQLKAVKATHELATTKNQLNDLERENKDLKSKLVAVEDRLVRAAGGSRIASDASISSDDQDTIKMLRQQLVEKSTEIATLEMRLERMKQHAEHFKDLSVAAEESIKQTNEAHKELLDSLQARFDQNNKQLTTTEQQLIQVEEENNMLKNEKYKVTGDVEKQTSELQKQLMSVRGELESALRRRDEAVKNEQVAVEDLKQQVTKAEEANDNYQREMLLHASAMQQLLQLKEKVKTYDSEIEEERIKSKLLDEQLKEKVEVWNVLEDQWKNEGQQLKQRHAEVEEQNKILHDQMQLLSSRMVELQSKLTTQPSPTKSFYASRDPVAVATAAAESGDASQSSQQLLDVIKFLRREKEISDTKSELNQSEIVRCKQQILQLEKQIFDVQEKLETEQKRALKAEEEATELDALKREVSLLRSTEEQNKVLRAEREQLDSDLRSSNNRIAQLQEDLSPLQAKNRQVTAQVTSLEAEKKSLVDEAERWKERVRQMTQSPRRQDPEEYRRLIQEKTTLSSKVDALSKEVTELKSANSKLSASGRSMESEVQSLKAQVSSFEMNLKSKDEIVEKCKATIEEKSQTVNRIRKVGRRFKLQYEELLRKQQEAEKETTSEEGKTPDQEKAAADAAKKLEEAEAGRKLAEASLAEERARLQAVSQELSRSQDEMKTIKSQLEEANKNMSAVGQSQSELQGENVALRSQSEETSNNLKEYKKQIDDLQNKNNEKEKKFKQLLALAKKQLENLRKDNQENSKNHEKLQEEVRRLESEKKSDAETKAELQSKIEELQRQLNEGRSTHTSSMQSSERKAAAVRPTSAQQVNQVKPMRVTRTARVMPEPQQETQDSDRPGSSSTSQAPASSTQVTAATTVSSVAPVSTATAFVYPMSPARQQSVGSSVTSGQGTQQEESRSSSGTGDSSTEGIEGDHAIVSSSDDPQQDESASGPNLSSTPVGAINVAEGEAPSSSGGPSRFVAPSSSASPSVSSANQPRTSHMGQKRSLEEDVSRPGNSREAKVAVAPLAKRQRPDQSSESVSASPSSGSSQSESNVTSAARQPDQSQNPEAAEADKQAQSLVTEQVTEPLLDVSMVTEQVSQSEQVDFTDNQSESVPQQSAATSSVEPVEDDVIVLSSDESNDYIQGEAGNEEMDDNDDIGVESGQDMIEDNDRQTPSTTRPEIPPFPQLSGPPPHLILPQDSARPRLLSRPAPLTPGIIAPPLNDDDSIVPCTPTLISHRHDDNYQAMNSPRVPPPATIRFQFEDVTQAPTSLAAVPGGLDSVDNTIMDLTGAGEDESSRNVPSASTAVSFFSTKVSASTRDTQASVGSSSAAVSSSIQEELEDCEEGDQTLPSSVESGSNEARSSIPTQPARGRRRFRVIGAPRTGASRGKGVNSPTTSNQP